MTTLEIGLLISAIVATVAAILFLIGLCAEARRGEVSRQASKIDYAELQLVRTERNRLEADLSRANATIARLRAGQDKLEEKLRAVGEKVAELNEMVNGAEPCECGIPNGTWTCEITRGY